MKKFIFAVMMFFLLILSIGNANAQAGVKDWTLILYFVPDEKIEDNLIGNINAISKVGSGANLNIVLMFDYASNKPTTYYYIDKGGTKKIKELGETNMGSPQTFYDFLKFSMTNYPANKYAVIVNSHGSGWESYYGANDESQIQLTRGGRTIAYDDDPKDCLTLKELKVALDNASKAFNKGKKIDLFAADACLFGMLEAVYELRDVVSVVMGSESTIPGNGFDYQTIAGKLTSAPNLNAPELSQIISKSFIKANGGGFFGGGGSNTLIGISTDNIEKLAVDISKLTGLLLQVNGKRSFSGISSIPEIDKYFDIAKIMDSIIAKNVSFTKDPKFDEILSQAKIVKESLKSASTTLEATGEFSKDDFGGLSIYWPDKERYSKFRDVYKKLDFNKKFGWDEFLDNQLLGMALAVRNTNAADNQLPDMINELDNAFASLRQNNNVRSSSENIKAQIDYLTNSIVNGAVSSHFKGNHSAVNETLKAVRNSVYIDILTKNKIIDGLKKGITAPVNAR